MDIIPIKRAILSVFKKDRITELGGFLKDQGADLLSTGGTGRALTAEGIEYQEVSNYTGSPEMLQGRVKTLHPKIHGGILFKREDPQQVAEAKQHGIHPIDLIAVNLYPFEETISKPDVTVETATENIDIGGPTMIRAAAKNFASVTVVTDPADYERIINEIKKKGGVSYETRKELAAKAFAHTSAYDQAITNYLSSI
jgi:phosphoribosylaminoimidazolecarboxamide formyltransferase/IMP cyclohydrolase